MSYRRQFRRSDGPRALPALLAVLALLMQALVPGVVAARESAGLRTLVLCSQLGETQVSLPDDTQPGPLAGFKCHDCVIAAVTAVTPPSPVVLPIRYAAIVRHERSRGDLAAAPTLPAPRPPGQGPPTLS